MRRETWTLAIKVQIREGVRGHRYSMMWARTWAFIAVRSVFLTRHLIVHVNVCVLYITNAD